MKRRSQNLSSRNMDYNKKYKKLLREYIEDFDDKWTSAVSSSEELRVALDLMKNIKSKLKGEIYIVGGVPRDLLMGNEVDDVDLATNIPVEELEKHFELRNISKNDSQPVYAILWGDYVYDLAKFRTDSGDIGRQSNVSTETDSFQKDSERRDLTINSFGLDENGKIVDYQDGLEDLKNKIVRAVGDPKKRFMEDATRILRVFRFAAKMDFEIDAHTKQAAIELKQLLQDPKAISKESISKEFFKSAKSGVTLMNFLKKLQDTGILHDILPEFTSMEGFDHSPIHHPEGDSQVLGHIYECLRASPFKDPVINLAVMFHDFGKAVTRGSGKDGFSNYHGHEAAGVPIVEGIFDRLKFNDLSQQDKKHILAAVDRHMLVHNLDKLSIETLTKLIHNPAWEVIKAVGYCDEASRGSGMFNEQEFNAKIERAEAKVSKIGGNQEDARKNLKKYVDGQKLMSWYPILQTDKTHFKEVMAAIQEYILETLNAGEEPSEEEIKAIAGGILKNDTFNEWVKMLESSIITPDYNIGDDKKKNKDGFCSHNPEINKYAFSSPESMFTVIAFTFFTIQRDWPDVTTRFPLFLQWFFEKAVNKKGKIVNPRYDDSEPFVTGTRLKTRAFSGKEGQHEHLINIWDNRKKIFDSLTNVRDNEFAMLDWILRNIGGLSLVKAGFLIQLITGKYGCMDSINMRVLGKLLTVTDFKISKTQLHTKGTQQKIQQYVSAVNELGSRQLWNDWCSIVARKIQFATTRGELENNKISINLPDGSEEKIEPYEKDVRNVKDIKNAKKKFKSGFDVSKDHMDLLKHAKGKYFESKNFHRNLLKDYGVDSD
jgi:tRNA nucleotidyltransferase/poly(A) polymerase